MRRSYVVFVTAVLAAACVSWGRSVSLDLRNPRRGGVRLMSATAMSDDGMLRTFDLDAGVADVGEVAVGDELTFTLFDDVTLTLVLKEKMSSPLGGDVFIAEASGYEGVKNAVVLRTAHGLVVDVQDYLNKRVYKVISAADGVTVQEIEPQGGGRCGCDALKRSVSGGSQPSPAMKSARRLLSNEKEAGDTYVDILVAYEQNAAAWVKSYGGGTTNFAQTAVQKMNVALANVGLDSSFRFRLVGVMETTTFSRDLEYVLDSIDSDVRGWKSVKTKRDEVGADIVSVLVDTGSAYGMVGLGWSLNEDTFEGFSETAFNACAIRAVAQDHTMTHEVGHNMGCGHSDVQETQPGPQMYSYSAGYYFSVGDEKFHTIMAYSGEGPGGEEAPYFSSPNHTYRGVPVGDASHDNAKTLVNTFAVASGWRDSSTGEVSGGDDEPEEEFFYDNDDFSSAKELTGANGKISGSTVDAIGDVGEFLAKKYMSRHTVWYKWTAESDGRLDVEVETADFDTVMAAFTGSSASRLTTVAYNDDKAKNENLSALSFDVRKGVTYHICLGGYMAARGDFRLKWRFIDAQEDAASLNVDVTDMTTEKDGTFTFDIGAHVTSVSTPSVAVSGLPSGLKYDAETMTISGKATKPGVYIVKVTATNASAKGKNAVVKQFALTVPNLASDVLPNLDQATGAYGTIMCGVAFDSGLVDCTYDAGWTVKVAGLPAGLKWDAKSGTITGIPTKAGTNTVTFTASKRGEANQIATITLMTAALPTWAQGTFAGYVAGTRDSCSCRGSATMTVAANGKVSGKIALDGTNWTFSATSYAAAEIPSADVDEASFVVKAVAKAGKATNVVELAVSGYAGCLPSLNGAVSGTFGDCEASLWRNMWKDKVSAAAAKAELAKWPGVYTVSFDDGGYLSLTVGNNGDVKVAGKLSDGTSVSATAPFVFHECWDFFTVFCVAPSKYKGGFVFLPIGFGTERGRLCEIGAGLPLVCSRNPQATGEYGAGFERQLHFVGAYYDKTKKLGDCYKALSFEATPPTLNGNSPTNEGAVVVTFDGKGKPVIPRNSGLSFSFTQATGIFKGGYMFIFDAKTKKKASFEGIMVREEDSLLGFYLWDASGTYEDRTGKKRTYKYKESYPVLLQGQ